MTSDTFILQQDYDLSLRRRWRSTLDDFLPSLLADCLLRSPDGTVTLSTQREIPYSQLRILPEGGIQTKKDLEHVALIHRDHIPDLLTVIAFACHEVQDPTVPFFLEDGLVTLRFYSAQLPSLAQALRTVSSYQGPLPFHAACFR